MIQVLRGGRIRGNSRRLLAAVGVAFVIVLFVGGLYVMTTGLGGGISFVPVTARLSRAGDALQPGDEVRYRNVIVGTVAGQGTIEGNLTRLELHIQPDQAPLIPANVTVRSMPITLFGSQFVQLLPPVATAVGHLGSGSIVEPDLTPGTAELQTAFTELNRLLIATHPAKLDAGLTAFATALQGNGETLGNLVQEFDDYLQQVAPSTPQLQDDLTRLANVTEELSRDAPNLLLALSNSITTAETITGRQQELKALLSGGIALTDQGTQLVNANGANLTTSVVDMEPVLGAYADNTAGLTNGVINLDKWFKTWGSAIVATPSGGAYARINIVIPCADGVQLILAANASPGSGKTFADNALRCDLNPPVYTSANCPRYPGASGPNCPAFATPAAASSTPSGGTVGVTGSPQEQQAVGRLLGLIGGPQALLPGVSDLLVGPLIRGVQVLVP